VVEVVDDLVPATRGSASTWITSAIPGRSSTTVARRCWPSAGPRSGDDACRASAIRSVKHDGTVAATDTYPERWAGFRSRSMRCCCVSARS
jgi:hypothetical protein